MIITNFFSYVCSFVLFRCNIYNLSHNIIYIHTYIYIKYVIDLKLLFFKTLLDWMSSVESHTISSIYDLMDAFNLCS